MGTLSSITWELFRVRSINMTEILRTLRGSAMFHLWRKEDIGSTWVVFLRMNGNSAPTCATALMSIESVSEDGQVTLNFRIVIP